MTNALHSLRFIATLGLASLGGTSTLAADQPANADGARAVDIALEADNAIRAVDPNTGTPSLIVDPSLPRPYGPPADEVASIEPDMNADFASVDAEVTSQSVRATASAPDEAPQGPAARVISQPVVQALPVAPPAPPKPAPKKVAAKKADPFTLKSILTVPEGPFRYGDWYWDESNAPKKGKLIVTVDLDARVISAFRDGHEIGTAVALLGTKKHPTPLGSFPILTKEKDNISEKYNNAPMPWTLRLTWDGIAIHGSPVINGYASHGCIGVPDEFAEKLFAIAKRGDRVLITRGKMVDVGDKLS
ncbi:MAG: L,D-transpeptidase family protein [Pseudomonadota bacterium]